VRGLLGSGHCTLNRFKAPILYSPLVLLRRTKRRTLVSRIQTLLRGGPWRFRHEPLPCLRTTPVYNTKWTNLICRSLQI
jgi:hypothetical protein